ncbi:MAG: DNA mismatch repair endonuclease MutL [Bacteroidales bacterium]|nr:DNA mismatch repair endonuclease MutL [Bacteroidales bacterium]
MDLIHLLPDSVANQIAAGEVIQRPASVVKELVENAVDAGARHIDIIAVDAGRTSLQVIDDGKGMSETDARLAFERHATSKITDAADLFALTTKGFRGEALPSIAAVAQVELTTRTDDQDLGTHLLIEASKVNSQEPVACAVGANFIVKNLFFNVPARRKFLKTNQTELSNITTELERIAIVHPDIAFTFTHNGTTLLSLSPSGMKQRISAIFGSRIAERLLNVRVQTDMVSIHGFVGSPESARRRGALQFFFVNNRFMRHPYFHKAVQEAFTQLIPADEQVPYFICFDVPPADIDVNIHPTKTEIKFENEQAIWQILLAAVRESLGRFNAIPTIEFDTEGRPADIPVFIPGSSTHPSVPTVSVDPTFNPFDTTPSSATIPSSGPFPFSRHSALTPSSCTPSQEEKGLWLSVNQEDGGQAVSGDVPAEERLHEILTESLSTDFLASSLFQYRGQFILTAVESGLMFIDQHHAHVRILYDRYLNQLTSKPGVTQGLLFPDVLQLSAKDVATFESIQPDLHALGLDVSFLGGDTVAINGLPAGLEGVDPQRLLLDLLASVAERGILDTEAVQGRLALTLARAAAIPAGQVLSTLEMHDLLSQLFATATPTFTPDGHTIVVILPQENIERMFK